MSGLIVFYPGPVEEVNFTILGSGSNGNAAYLETPGARVLIDCGFSAKRIRTALLELDRTPERLEGILITHEHSDHIHGLKVLAAKRGIPPKDDFNAWYPFMVEAAEHNRRLFEPTPVIRP